MKKLARVSGSMFQLNKTFLMLSSNSSVEPADHGCPRLPNTYPQPQRNCRPRLDLHLNSKLLQKTFAHRDLEEPAGRIASEDDRELKTTRQASDTILKVAAEGVELTHEFFESVADRLTDPMADEEQARQIIGQCFHDFEHQTPPIRTEVIHTCDGLLDEGFITSRPQWIGLITDPLLSVLTKEEDSRILAETASLLSRTVTSLIQFGDYGPGRSNPCASAQASATTTEGERSTGPAGRRYFLSRTRAESLSSYFWKT